MKIKVKCNDKAKQVPVKIYKETENEVNVDSVVVSLRELSDKDFRMAIKIAKQYRKADKLLEDVMPITGGLHD